MKQKFIGLADCHIRSHKDAPEDFTINRFRELFKTVIKACLENTAILLISGDLLDSSSPKLIELKLIFEFFTMLNENKIKTILVSGNHEDITEGVNIFDYLPVQAFNNIYCSDKPYVVYGPDIVIHPLDHDKLNSWQAPGRLEGKFNILLSHIRASYGPFIQEEFPITKLEEHYDLVLLGDLHVPLKLSEKTHYCNHPLNSSYEQKPDCSFILLTIEGNKYDIQRIPTDLPNLIQRNCKVEDFGKLELDPKHYYKVNVEGTREELRAIPNILPNAKIVKQPIDQLVYDSEVELDEEPEVKAKDLLDEFIQYMQQLKYEDQLVVKMMEELNRGVNA